MTDSLGWAGNSTSAAPVAGSFVHFSHFSYGMEVYGAEGANGDALPAAATYFLVNNCHDWFM